MNNPVEIDEFLKYYAKIYKQNPELPILRDTIYHGLMTYGLKEEEKPKQMKKNKIRVLNICLINGLSIIKTLI